MNQSQALLKSVVVSSTVVLRMMAVIQYCFIKVEFLNEQPTINQHYKQNIG